MPRLGTMVNKADIELDALGLTLGVPSSKKLSLLPGLCQGSILGSHSPPGSPTVTTLGCHCMETVFSPPLPGPAPNSGICPYGTWVSCLSCPRIP